VLEFNSRFGDPETQATLPLLQSDLFEAMMASVQGKLDQIQLQHYDNSSCCVVMTAKGYPGSYPKEEPISGIEDAARSTNTYVFHAGTKAKDGQIVTNGGRVLGVTGVGANLAQAIQIAYSGVNRIKWASEHHRTDIGHKGVNYER
jgi:phosphoribosylamine--glycine ligase